MSGFYWNMPRFHLGWFAAVETILENRAQMGASLFAGRKPSFLLSNRKQMTDLRNWLFGQDSKLLVA